MSDQLKAETNGLSIASLVFGIFALLTSITVVPVIFMSSMAIMFSWLSRGNRRMNGQALAGNILAIISIIISIGHRSSLNAFHNIHYDVGAVKCD